MNRLYSIAYSPILRLFSQFKCLLNKNTAMMYVGLIIHIIGAFRCVLTDESQVLKRDFYTVLQSVANLARPEIGGLWKVRPGRVNVCEKINFLISF